MNKLKVILFAAAILSIAVGYFTLTPAAINSLPPFYNLDNAIRSELFPNQRSLLDEETFRSHCSEQDKLLQELGGHEIAPTTSDGVHLDALFFPTVDTGRSGSTTILCVGRGGLQHKNRARIENYLANGYNVVTFNYRGVGKSEGTPSGSGVIKDVEAVIDYVHDEQGVPYEQIVLHGFSYGGGVAAAAAVSDGKSGINVVHERSYSILSAAALRTLDKQHYFPNVIAFANKTGLLSFVTSCIFQTCGWQIDSRQSWSKISGKKVVLYHPDDPVISPDASLFTALKANANAVDNTLYIIMERGSDGNPHTRALTEHEWHQLFNHLEQETKGT